MESLLLSPTLSNQDLIANLLAVSNFSRNIVLSGESAIFWEQQWGHLPHRPSHPPSEDGVLSLPHPTPRLPLLDGMLPYSWINKAN